MKSKGVISIIIIIIIIIWSSLSYSSSYAWS
jgi:hypothetical protein